MREIKFRGKSLNGGDWVYGCLITNDYPTHGKTTQIYNNNGFIIVAPKTVGQYTGLKLKGKELYEGDVVKLKWGIQQKDGHIDSNGKVVFINGGFEIVADAGIKGSYKLNEFTGDFFNWYIDFSNSKGRTYYTAYDFEIIGHVYE